MNKTTHKLLSLLCSAALLLTLLPAGAVAKSQPEVLPEAPGVQTHTEGDVTASGPIGDNATWILTSDGTLTISGTGSTWSYPEEYPEFMDYVDNITSIVIEAGITEIGDYLFFECFNAQSVTIPEGVTRIGVGAFAYCASLLEVTIPGTLDAAGEGAFMYCVSLTDATLSEGCTQTFDYMFFGCVSLANVSLPDTFCFIGEGSFGECVSLTAIELPYLTFRISDYAFYCCASLTSITLPAEIDGLGEGSFAYCYSLSTITFQGDRPTFSVNCLFDVTAAIRYPAGNTTWNFNDINWWFSEDSANITWTPYGGNLVATGGCGKELTWTLTSDGLLSISGTGEMDDYDLEDNGPAPWKGRAYSHVVLDEGITGIGSYAFYSTYRLVEVELPSTLTSIGDHAFYYATSLPQIVIPDGVTEIGEAAFSVCPALTHIELPDSLTAIAGSTFWTTGLTFIEVPAGVTFIGDDAFNNSVSLTEVKFLGGAPAISATAFTGVSTNCTYPSNQETWTEDKFQNYGGTLIWSSYYVCPHSYVAGEVTPPTCAEQGFTTYVCELCGDSYQGDFVPTNCPSGKFTDVSVTAWYHPYVDFVVERGLMNGTSGTTFAPTTVINRASVAVLLWNMAGQPEHHVTENPFHDVKEDFWYTNAIFWAYENGVVSGNGAGGFNPNDNVTREQLAVMLYNFSHFMGYELTAVRDVDLASFPDGATTSTWAASYLKWACDLGLINGKAQGGQNYLAPRDTATRAEIAVIFTNFTKLVENA